MSKYFIAVLRKGLTVSVPSGFYRAEGMIKNVNTIEEYKNIDKAAMLQQAGRTVRIPFDFVPRLNRSALGCD